MGWGGEAWGEAIVILGELSFLVQTEHFSKSSGEVKIDLLLFNKFAINKWTLYFYQLLNYLYPPFPPCPSSLFPQTHYAFSPSGLYKSIKADPDAPHKAYLDYIESLPLNAEPEVFGMHDNANITCAITGKRVDYSVQ